MGCHPNVNYDKFPIQGQSLNRKVKVIFHYQDNPNTGEGVYGKIVRDDREEPFLTIIHLEGGKHILATECQYSYVD